MAQLHIGAMETELVIPHGESAQRVYSLPLGSHRTAQEFFRHDPPTEGELEMAIATVEDLVMGLAAGIPEGERLETQDACIREIAQVAGVGDAPDMLLELDAMERVFNRLADVAAGTPAPRAGIPQGPAFAATLLILREAMHHLRFDAIRVRTD